MPLRCHCGWCLLFSPTWLSQSPWNFQRQWLPSSPCNPSTSHHVGFVRGAFGIWMREWWERIRHLNSLAMCMWWGWGWGGQVSDMSYGSRGCRVTVCFIVTPVSVVFTEYLHRISSHLIIMTTKEEIGLPVVRVGKVRLWCQRLWYGKRELSGVEGRISSHHCFLNEISFYLKGEGKLMEIGRDKRQ